MVFIFKLYRNKQGEENTLYGENIVIAGGGGGNLTFPTVLHFPYSGLRVGGGVNLLMLFSKLPKRSGKCLFYGFLQCLFMLVFLSRNDVYYL